MVTLTSAKSDCNKSAGGESDDTIKSTNTTNIHSHLRGRFVKILTPTKSSRSLDKHLSCKKKKQSRGRQIMVDGEEEQSSTDDESSFGSTTSVSTSESSRKKYTLNISISCHRSWIHRLCISVFIGLVCTIIIYYVLLSKNISLPFNLSHYTIKAEGEFSAEQYLQQYQNARHNNVMQNGSYLRQNANNNNRAMKTNSQHRRLQQLNGFNDPRTVEQRQNTPLSQQNDNVVMASADDVQIRGNKYGQVPANDEWSVVDNAVPPHLRSPEGANDNNDQAWKVENGEEEEGGDGGAGAEMDALVDEESKNALLWNNEQHGELQQDQHTNGGWDNLGAPSVEDAQGHEVVHIPPLSDINQDMHPAQSFGKYLNQAGVQSPPQQQQQQQQQQQPNFQQQQQQVESLPGQVLVGDSVTQQQQVGSTDGLPPSEVYWEQAVADLQSRGIASIVSGAQQQQQHQQGGVASGQVGGVENNFDQLPGHGIHEDLATIDSDLIHHPLETVKHLKQEFIHHNTQDAESVAAHEGGFATVNDANAPPQPQQPVDMSATMASYNLENCFLTVQAFRYTLFFFVYDAKLDEFIIIHNIKGCNFGCNRVYRVASTIAFGLRKNFPGRFAGASNGSEDLVLMLSTGDAPRVKNTCLGLTEYGDTNYCGSINFAPILQFGSVFMDSQYLPSMIAMPVPVRPHLPCFDEWQASDGEYVCPDIQPKDFSVNTAVAASDAAQLPRGGLIFGEELGMITEHNQNLNHGNNYWDHLIPQVIWRGTDFVFLHTLYPRMRAVTYAQDIEPKAVASGGLDQFVNEYDKTKWVIDTMWSLGDMLLPRWRGVLLTSEAELEAEYGGGEEDSSSGIKSYQTRAKDKALPWVNIKFANINNGGVKVAAADYEEYQILDKLGISVIGDYVNMTEQAKYKYHLDLGGGGGTTWTGTIEKLALPGLLFHHVTPTKDWYHDLLVPWEHYVPVNADLSDLRAKFEWAQSHPKEAKNIAENGSKFARWMGSKAGFGQLYDQHFMRPLRNVVNAYQTTLPTGYEGQSISDIIMEAGKGEFDIVSRCKGLDQNSCEAIQ